MLRVSNRDRWEELIEDLARRSGYIPEGEKNVLVESILYKREFEALATRLRENEAFNGAKVYYIGHLIVCGLDGDNLCGGLDLRSRDAGDVISAPDALALVAKMRAVGWQVMGCSGETGGASMVTPGGIDVRYSTNKPELTAECTANKITRLRWKVPPSFERPIFPASLDE